MRPTLGAGIGAFWFTLGASIAIAADHNEAPLSTADHIGDIDDVYAWHDGSMIVTIVTFAGPGAEKAAPPDTFDADMLYTIHVDNTGDYVSDIDILVRFGQDSIGGWGVQFENVPGSTGTVSGAVQTTIDAGNGLSVEAGVYDDPFFFDFTGLVDTLNTATVSFDSTRDSFAGKNVNAIVVQMDQATATGGGSIVHIWASSGRKP